VISVIWSRFRLFGCWLGWFCTVIWIIYSRSQFVGC
jgi:hypothetical protein